MLNPCIFFLILCHVFKLIIIFAAENQPDSPAEVEHSEGDGKKNTFAGWREHGREVSRGFDKVESLMRPPIILYRCLSQVRRNAEGVLLIIP